MISAPIVACLASNYAARTDALRSNKGGIERCNNAAKCSETGRPPKQQTVSNHCCNTLSRGHPPETIATHGDRLTHSPSFTAETALFGTILRFVFFTCKKQVHISHGNKTSADWMSSGGAQSIGANGTGARPNRMQFRPNWSPFPPVDDPGIAVRSRRLACAVCYSSSNRSETSTINLEGRPVEYIMCISDRARVKPT